MRVYISGPIALGGTITDPDVLRTNIHRFTMREATLRFMGHDPVNPTTLHGHDEITPRENGMRKSWAEYMRTDLAALVTCDAITLLPNWQLSRGARLEAHIAFDLGFALIELPE